MTKHNDGLPTERRIIPPKGGWKEGTFYIVEVSYSAINPIHKSLFYSGFLNGKKTDDGTRGPGGYNVIFHPASDNSQLSEAYYMKVLEELSICL